jgi:hypothetical protein
VPDSVLDAVSETAALRAVRAKVHAEAVSVCPSCGRRHLLDGHCSAAPDMTGCVEGVGAQLDGFDDTRTGTGSDAANERDHTRARRLVGSVIVYLGLDPGSFGEVDDDRAPWSAADAGPPEWPRPARSRARRAIAFLGFDVSATDNVSADEDGDGLAAAPSASTDEQVAPDEEIAPDDPPAGTQLPIEWDACETAPVTTSDDASRRDWHRADDDILPLRRPRLPRRAWRDRVTSRD